MNTSSYTLETLEFDKVRSQIAKRTVSALGQKEVDTLSPSDDLERIEGGLRPVLEGIDLIAFDTPISLHRIPDIRRSLGVCATPGAVLTISELLQVGEILEGSHRLLITMSARKEKYPRLWDLTSRLVALPDLEAGLNAALDPATEKVKDSASSELRRIRRGIEGLRDSIRERVASILSKLPDDVVQDRLVTIRSGRFVIPIRENQKRRMEGLVHDQSASGTTLFIEPMATVDMHNRLRQLELAERQEIERILRALTASVAEVREALQDNLEILGRFDAITAKAAFARDLDCTEPIFNTEGQIVLRGARHPLLVSRLRNEDQSEALVPLDLTLGEDGCRTLILTGPNAGGKTVALKTVGLLALMAQAGLPIPALPKSELPVFSGVFADIGDAQSIENDLSTFSSHMTHLVNICAEANGGALVLLDEIGGSTDPDEGSALAIALLQELTRRGCRTLATTHHGALKAVAHESEGMANGSMAFDAETLRPTFQLRLNLPGSSYAFEIARRLGLPSEIVDGAAQIAGSGVRRVESLIADLDETYTRYREELEQARSDRREVEALKADTESRLQEVERRERDLKKTAREKAQKIVAGANALIERTVRDIRQQQANRESIREAHARIREAKEKLDRALLEESPPADLPIPGPGDRVWLRTLAQEGMVVSEPNSAGRLLVEVGNLKIEVSPADLEIRQTALEETDPKATVGFSGPETIPSEIDVRGLIFDEAANQVDKYLDDLFLARMHSATIIHGKGTGALRRKLGDYLKQHPRIKSQRLGDWNEGGSGVTIVELDNDR